LILAGFGGLVGWWDVCVDGGLPVEERRGEERRGGEEWGTKTGKLLRLFVLSDYVWHGM
jgi:hypothetical protein